MTERPVVEVQNLPAPVVQVTEEDGTTVLVVADAPPGVVTVEIPGPPGPPGAPAPGGGSDAHYVHEQPVADTVWTVNHNLGKRPSITVEDSAGTVVVGRYANPDVNTSVLRFSAPFGGRAYFN